MHEVRSAAARISDSVVSGQEQRLDAEFRAVAFEGGPHGVRCNAVAPGIIWSKFVRRYEESFRDEIEKTPLRRIGEPSEVADAVAFLVSEQSSFVTGEVLNVSGGWYMHA